MAKTLGFHLISPILEKSLPSSSMASYCAPAAPALFGSPLKTSLPWSRWRSPALWRCPESMAAMAIEPGAFPCEKPHGGCQTTDSQFNEPVNFLWRICHRDFPIFQTYAEDLIVSGEGKQLCGWTMVEPTCSCWACLTQFWALRYPKM